MGMNQIDMITDITQIGKEKKMGVIRITTEGSFGQEEKVFGAIEHGHAHCVNEVMEYLTDLQRRSINKDHALQKEGSEPEKGFTKEKGV